MSQILAQVINLTLKYFCVDASGRVKFGEKLFETKWSDSDVWPPGSLVFGLSSLEGVWQGEVF